MVEVMVHFLPLENLKLCLESWGLNQWSCYWQLTLCMIKKVDTKPKMLIVRTYILMLLLQYSKSLSYGSDVDFIVKNHLIII